MKIVLLLLLLVFSGCTALSNSIGMLDCRELCSFGAKQFQDGSPNYQAYSYTLSTKHQHFRMSLEELNKLKAFLNSINILE